MKKVKPPTLAMLTFDQLVDPDVAKSIKDHNGRNPFNFLLSFTDTDIKNLLELTHERFCTFVRGRNKQSALPKNHKNPSEGFALLSAYASLGLCCEKFGTLQCVVRSTMLPKMSTKRYGLIQFIFDLNHARSGKADPLGSAQQAFRWIALKLDDPLNYQMMIVPRQYIPVEQYIHRKIFE